jgi:uncharacterized circularly permuted ATP-grasp superfamily protein
MAGIATKHTLPAPFHEYELDDAFDEMVDSGGAVRPHYRHIYEALRELTGEELRRRQQIADLSFLHQGITFTVYGRDEGTERIFPNDLLPRVLTREEWTRIEHGLTQRITALNLFLKDIYHEGKILNDGVVPRETIFSCKHFRRQMRGFRVRKDAYVTVAGTDLIRMPSGEFVVLVHSALYQTYISYPIEAALEA